MPSHCFDLVVDAFNLSGRYSICRMCYDTLEMGAQEPSEPLQVLIAGRITKIYDLNDPLGHPGFVVKRISQSHFLFDEIYGEEEPIFPQ